MNFSREHKYVFILDKFCGEKNVTQYLEALDFKFFQYGKETPLKRDNYSNLKKIPKEFMDFTLVRLVDNPYWSVINEFMKISNENWSLKQYTKDFFIDRFNKWLNLYFENWEELYYEGIILDGSYNFLFFDLKNGKKPHYWIKKDSIEQDLKQIPLFDGIEPKIREIFFPKSNFDFKDIYSYENARKIFKLNRDFSIETQYDPFSFTTQELTKKEKVDFIHW